MDVNAGANLDMDVTGAFSVEATSRARGLVVQGQKTVEVVAGAGRTPEEPAMPVVAETPKKVPGLIESLQKKRSDNSSAKVPIGSP
jgi:hypothetical protein